MVGIVISLSTLAAFLLFAAFGMFRYTVEFWRERDMLGLGLAGCFWIFPIGVVLAVFGI